jgi:hypothetical protein
MRLHEEHQALGKRVQCGFSPYIMVVQVSKECSAWFPPCCAIAGSAMIRITVEMNVFIRISLAHGSGTNC